ncbi:MAG: hypothetical protein ACOVNV_09890, partial [Pirellulaceae bacterium]
MELWSESIAIFSLARRQGAAVGSLRMEARELVDSLPPHLAERCRWMESPRGPGDLMRSGIVVY